MGAFVVYVLKSSLLLALLVSLFMLLMSKETFHRLNRYIMLLLLSLSLIVPFLNIGTDTPLAGIFTAIESGFTEKRCVVSTVPDVLVEVEETETYIDFGDFVPLFSFESGMADAVYPSIDSGTDLYVQELEPGETVVVEKVPLWLQGMAALYIIGVLFLIIRQAVMYIQVARIIAHSRVVDASLYGCEGISLRVHNGKGKPFSWFRWVIVSEDDLGDGAREILIHETTHAHAGHSWDIVLADAVIIMQWFNPLAWIMKNSLKDIHEFEADEAVINSGVNAKQYQLLIIKKAVGARLYSIANSFNHSLTKKRITMMCKEKSKKWRCAKALYIIPVAAVAALSFSTVDTANATESETLPKGSEFVANNEKETAENYVQQVPDGDDKVYQVCEKVPEFPGGSSAMMKFLAENIKYPADALEAGKGGKAILQFVVKKDGTVNDVCIMKSSGMPSLDDEALRVVRSMPKWNPGTLGGKPVNVQYTLPVAFKLSDGKINNENKKNGKKDNRIVIGNGGVVLDTDVKDKALIVVDGEVFDGDLKELESSSITHVEVIKNSALIAELKEKYNTKGKEGIIFITTSSASPVTSDAGIVGNPLLIVNGRKVDSPFTQLADSSVVIEGSANVSIVLDGEPYEGNPKDLDPAMIESIVAIGADKLSAADIKKYNAKDKDGIIFIATSSGSHAGIVGNPAPVVNGKKEDLPFTVDFIEERTTDDGEKIYQICEIAPEYPGGFAELNRWLRMNVRYPKAARDINGQGKVFVRFVVRADGSISNAEVVKSDFSSNYSEVSLAEQTAKEIEYYKNSIERIENDCKELEQHIEEWKNKLAVLEKDGTSENILNRRREELEKAQKLLEDERAKIVIMKRTLAQKKEMLANSKNELDMIMVTAFKNEKGEALSTDEVIALRAAAENALKDEAVRVVSAMPKWNPGTQGGKAVNVSFTLPVTFRLQ